MTTIHTPRTTLSSLLVENVPVINAAPLTRTAYSTISQSQTVAGVALAQLTWLSQSLVQPTTSGTYRVDFSGVVNITSSSGSSASGVSYWITVGGLNTSNGTNILTNATSGVQCHSTAMTWIVNSPVSAPVLGVAASCPNSGDSSAWLDRNITWTKIAG